MTTRGEIEKLIRTHSAETGSLAAALQRLPDLLLAPAQSRRAVDVFPSCHLAGAVEQLCRCRGMIQEVQPEVHLFCASRQHLLSPAAAAAPTPAHSAEDDPLEFMDAVSLYVIPVPGNDHFYTVDDATAPSTEAARATSSSEAHAERKRRDRGCGPTPAVPANTAEHSAPLCEEEEGDRSRKLAKIAVGNVMADVASPDAALVGGLSLNLPHPSRHPQLQTACVVTVLLPSMPPNGDADRRRSPFRVNDVIDFYGFQHFPDDQLAVNEDDDFLRFSAWNATELSKGLVSRLLCLAYSPVSSVHLPYAVSTAALQAADVAEHRTHALRYLSEHLTEGDELAAAYVLLHLCAKVCTHSDALPVGDLPLLVTSPRLCAEEWSLQLRRITPVAEVFLRSEALRAAAPTRLTPRYNNELNYLQSGLLQVANGSHVTIDCTALGTHDGAWYEGMFALVHKQLLLLEYPYQTLELPVDVTVLALHAAPDLAALHPLFQFAVCVCWEPSSRSPEKDAAQSSLPASDVVRRYLATVRQLPAKLEELDESVSAQASAALLEMSHDIPGWNNRDPLLHNNSFSVATALMRAHAASWGRSNFTADDIAMVRQLERARVARLRDASA
ncbi:hypothetical protein ABB37_00801 [Leptomonas pyrrhocoris]|uniref:Mini-chromosome maintenance complex-binding protein n=1 Tax=Leptomonas pyrrhocoris TaxID=157538 RepID=A0A0N0E0Q4_LEPPY|nr:hypothetical protein ABB37_00801 [Leptomonas pyrrhocoris]XP_015665151.1 hypothetical protein ABB37_00801 [Leptomonas pyrrhocoris]KPA86711.1 hypothetical protein ABB37_00801 [Leptomonas pyrrhocoris]KPA86712.1 hypothetical protein ABB37_00801 [Leptomonas pyrrhocoris]|eukprot:XP_015665150.1 hypothetical protein ABB37_00801 [Leptomonas pyrrhocoris]